MVKGLDVFRSYFSGFEEQYILIGGAACDIVFDSNDVNFRATRDLDMVLIVESKVIQDEECCQVIRDNRLRLMVTELLNIKYLIDEYPINENAN